MWNTNLTPAVIDSEHNSWLHLNPTTTPKKIFFFFFLTQNQVLIYLHNRYTLHILQDAKPLIRQIWRGGGSGGRGFPFQRAYTSYIYKNWTTDIWQLPFKFISDLKVHSEKRQQNKTKNSYQYYPWGSESDWAWGVVTTTTPHCNKGEIRRRPRQGQ